MSLNELVNIYNQKFNSHGRSTIATDPSHYTPQSNFTMNTDNLSSNANFSYTQSASSALLFDGDTSRFQLNDRVLGGESVRPPAQNRFRVERIKHVDKLDFSAADTELAELENNPEYTSRYPDVKPQLNIINAQQAQIPPIDMYTNPGEQVQRLIHQGKLKNLHGFVALSPSNRMNDRFSLLVISIIRIIISNLLGIIQIRKNNKVMSIIILHELI